MYLIYYFDLNEVIVLRKTTLIGILMLAMLIIFPKAAFAQDKPPEIKGQAAITMDVDTGEIIYSKNIDKRMYPASITKIVTAMILADKKKPSDIFTYSAKAKSQEPSKLDLPVGEKVSAANAMNAMLMYSANDIAYMIAENISGNMNDFSKLMNDKVKQLGLTNTNFITPNGLPNPNHYTTAYDLAIMTKELYKYPWIMDTIGKKETVVATSSSNIKITNTNKLLGQDGCVGGKTGYTDAAGRCLMTLYEKNDRRILGIVLKSELDSTDSAVFNDMKSIINWSYSTQKVALIKGNSVIKTVNTTYNIIPFLPNNLKINLPFINLQKSASVDLIVKDDILKYENDIPYEIQYNVDNFDTRDLDVNKTVGTMTVRLLDGTHVYKLYPSKSFDKSFTNNFILIMTSAFLLLQVAFAVIGTKLMNSSKKKAI